MQTIHVALGERTYPIHIGSSLLGQAELLLPHLARPRVAVISNERVAPLYLSRLSALLQSAGVAVLPIVLPDGEQHKNWETLNRIFDALLQSRCDRKTTLIALGGGVIGDLAGFAAATYQRGVPYLQIPTTLLSQVDSSVGGKTGINHPLGKNMIGAFYQPQVVIADTDTLTTLPSREFSAGLAEVIKYGLIRDLPFLEWLERQMDTLMARDPAALSEAIARSCVNKAEIVAQDERESGVRALLNFGHTFGHAIEAATGYGTWLHGEAVAAGMVLAARLSARLGYVGEAEVERIGSLLTRARLPTAAPEIAVDRFLQLMAVDKKVDAGKIRFVLLRSVGEAFVTGEVPESLLREILASREPLHA
jgi:3-dehydroquinate synthase